MLSISKRLIGMQRYVGSIYIIIIIIINNK